MITTSFKQKGVFIQSVYVVMTITGIVLLPIIIHLIPYSGAYPLGAYMLPMFIAPLVAAFFVSPFGLIIATIVAPIVNYMLTGMPAIPLMYFLIIEIMLYALFSSWIVKNNQIFPGFSTAGIITAKLIVLLPKIFILSGSITLHKIASNIVDLKVSIPGVIILFIIERYLSKQDKKE